MDSIGPDTFLYSEFFDPEALLPTQAFHLSDNNIFSWDPTWDEYLELDFEPESIKTDTQPSIFSKYASSSTIPLQMLESLPHELDNFIPQITNAGKTSEPTNTEKLQQVVFIDSHASVINANQFGLEQSESHSDSPIGSIMNPIVLDGTGDFTNPIVLDDTGNQENNLEVHLSQSRSTTGSSFHLKRKRSISDDWITNKDERNMNSYCSGSRACNISLHPQQAVRLGYAVWTAIEKLLEDPNMTVPGDSDDV